MKIASLILLMALMPVACGHLPEIRALEDSSTASRTAACSAIFPQGQWQFVHAVEIIPPMGSKQTVLGIIQVSSVPRTLHWVLMTIEGLVLFEADFDGAITVQRALPPLDRPGMAEGMLQDISLLFLPPKEPCIAAGDSKDGAWICRYPCTDGGCQDIVLQPDGDSKIRLYSRDNRLTRTVGPIPGKDHHAGGLPSQVTLKAHGLMGYELRLSLIEAVSLGK
jgi:hypothetical protein